MFPSISMTVIFFSWGNAPVETNLSRTCFGGVVRGACLRFVVCSRLVWQVKRTTFWSYVLRPNPPLSLGLQRWS